MNPTGVTGEQGSTGVRYHFGRIVVDTAAHTLTRDGLPQPIEPKAFAVLLVLLRHADQLVGRDDLLDTVWGHRHVTPGVLTRAIAQLRAALDDHPHEPRFIQTQHALGYRFIGELRDGEPADPVAGPVVAGQAPELTAAPTAEPPLEPTSAPTLEPPPEPEPPPQPEPPAAIIPVLATDPDPPVAGEAGIPDALVLQRRRDDLEVPARGPRASSRFRVNRAWIAAAAVVVIAVATLAWFNRRMPASGPPSASIAVLPFTSLSDDPEDGYFAKGLAVEMHNALAGIPGLKVAAISPAGPQASPRDIKALGRRLGVATVLDANVRREGDRLRVNARLADTATGFTLWSESYDRQANDVFAVQTEIASEVVRALPGVLTVHRRTYRQLWPTNNLSAYEAYLKGQQQLLAPANDDYLDKAIGFFGEALAADAGFARAQAGICRAEIIRFEAARDTPAFDRAQAACTQAAQMDPELREVNLALGELHRVRGDYAQANEYYTLALDDLGLRPAAYVGLARVQSEQGNDELALEYFELARQLHPGDPLVYRERGYHQYLNGDLDAAIESFRTATTLQPDDPSLWNSLGGLYLAGSDDARAADAFQRSLALKPSYATLSNLGTLRYTQGAYADAARLYRRAAGLDPTDFRIWGNIGDALAAQPETAEQAREPYRRAAQLAQDYLAIKAEDAQAQALLGFYQASLGDADAAREHLAKAEALDTERGEVALLSAQALALLGDASGALARLGQARKEGIPEQRIQASPALRKLLAAGPLAPDKHRSEH